MWNAKDVTESSQDQYELLCELEQMNNDIVTNF
jgi:hypothetical protein